MTAESGTWCCPRDACHRAPPPRAQPGRARALCRQPGRGRRGHAGSPLHHAVGRRFRPSWAGGVVTPAPGRGARAALRVVLRRGPGGYSGTHARGAAADRSRRSAEDGALWAGDQLSFQPAWACAPTSWPRTQSRSLPFLFVRSLAAATPPTPACRHGPARSAWSSGCTPRATSAAMSAVDSSRSGCTAIDGSEITSSRLRVTAGFQGDFGWSIRRHDTRPAASIGCSPRPPSSTAIPSTPSCSCPRTTSR